jgi:23S rRNA (cytidine1920-2'-O)/16S rRNA (cytidine1409-2'-O)-methyltransferase
MANLRVDQLLVERGLAESRAQAQRLVMAGKVRADGQVLVKPSTRIPPEARLDIESGPPFVSRGGEKLAAALVKFPVMVQGQICADVGAATGGFTDCLLQNGAARVYAIDVGKGGLHWKLRNDPRVVTMEGVNARHLKSLPEPAALVTVDASFISLRLLLPALQQWLPAEGGEVVALIKPQFEAGREQASAGRGVIRDPKIHAQVLREVLSDAQKLGFRLKGLMASPLRGPKGNVEFLAWLATSGLHEVDLESLIEMAISAPPPQPPRLSD